MPINKLAHSLEWCLHQHSGHSTPLDSTPDPTRPDQTRPDQTRDSAIVWVHKFSKRDTRKPDEPSVACVAFLASSSTLHSSPHSFPPWPILCLCKCLCVILVVVVDLRFCWKIDDQLCQSRLGSVRFGLVVSVPASLAVRPEDQPRWRGQTMPCWHWWKICVSQISKFKSLDSTRLDSRLAERMSDPSYWSFPDRANWSRSWHSNCLELTAGGGGGGGGGAGRGEVQKEL